jgi:hypothetical protein
LVALTLVLALASGCSGSTEVNAYAWKASSRDATTLTLVILTGPDDEVLEGEVVSESETQVIVAAIVDRSDGPQTANGVFREVDVELDAPLGERDVVNRDGTPVPEQEQ